MEADRKRCIIPFMGDREPAETPSTCVFCDIVNGRAPASVVYEDEQLISFLDINPVTEGHLLIIPRVHRAYLADLEPSEFSAMALLGQRLGAALRRSGLRCEGINLFYADGEAAFQEVFHAHLHVFPRYEGDSFRISADWDGPLPRADLDEGAAKIRSALHENS